MAVAREIVREKDSVYRRAQVPCGGAVYGDENLLFIANDWHTALLPVFLQAYYRDHGKLTYARCALVIHNMAHQGRGPLAEFQRLGIPDQYRDAFYLDDPFGGECMNILKAGLTTAHRLVAVSHGYAWRASPPPPPPPPRRPRPSLAARGDACLFGSSGVRLKRAGRIAPTVALPAGGTLRVLRPTRVRGFRRFVKLQGDPDGHGRLGPGADAEGPRVEAARYRERYRR